MVLRTMQVSAGFSNSREEQSFAVNLDAGEGASIAMPEFDASVDTSLFTDTFTFEPPYDYGWVVGANGRGTLNRR